MREKKCALRIEDLETCRRIRRQKSLLSVSAPLVDATGQNGFEHAGTYQHLNSCFRSNTDGGFSEMNGSIRSACRVAHSIHALYFGCFSADHKRNLWA